jgi:hypothetical protein
MKSLSLCIVCNIVTFHMVYNQFDIAALFENVLMRMSACVCKYNFHEEQVTFGNTKSRASR